MMQNYCKFNDTKSAKIVAAAMEEATDTPVKVVMNWNTVLKGQKTSGAGFTSGLRFVYELDGISSSGVNMTKQPPPPLSPPRSSPSLRR